MILFTEIQKKINIYSRVFCVHTKRQHFDLLLFLIFTYYLTAREARLFAFYRAYLNGVRQREIELLMNVSQSKISVDFKKLLAKLRITANFLSEIKWEQVAPALRDVLTREEFTALNFLLLGKKPYNLTRWSVEKRYRLCRSIKRWLNTWTNPQMQLLPQFLSKSRIL